MPKQVRVGLIGAGFVGNIHARAYRRATDLDVDVAAVAAVPLAQAAELGRLYGIGDVYDDYRRILDRDDINLVDLCVPNHLHERFVIEAAQAGKHIVCEKPFTGYFGGPGASRAGRGDLQGAHVPRGVAEHGSHDRGRGALPGQVDVC